MSYSRWHLFNQAQSSRPARPRVLRTLDKFMQSPGHVLDVGAGSGRDCAEFLRRGWQVTALEPDQRSVEMLLELGSAFPQRFEVLPLRMEEFRVDKLKKNDAEEGRSPKFHLNFDLVNASFSLPFCQPSFFRQMWKELVQSLKSGGLISAEIFGERDDWNKNGKGKELSFLSREKLDLLLTPFELLEFKEVEDVRPSFSGEDKKWHFYSVIAKKK